MSEDNEPLWLDTDQVLYLHDLAIERHGGLPGVRDQSALESAVFRPQQFFHYESERDLSALAALYAEGIMANNHPFNDGNKRTGYAAASMFLFANGRDLQPAQDTQERVSFFEDVASGNATLEELSQFYRENTISREQERSESQQIMPEEQREASQADFAEEMRLKQDQQDQDRDIEWE